MKIDNREDEKKEIDNLESALVLSKVNGHDCVWKVSKPVSGPQYIRESEPRGESDDESKVRREESEEYAHESDEHDDRNKWYYGDIGEGRNKRYLSEVDNENRESKCHCSQTHGERFADPKPFREKRKQSGKEIPEEQEPKNGEKREMKADIIIEYERIPEYKYQSDSDEQRKCVRFLSGKQDSVRNESEYARS